MRCLPLSKLHKDPQTINTNGDNGKEYPFEHREEKDKGVLGSPLLRCNLVFGIMFAK